MRCYIYGDRKALVPLLPLSVYATTNTGYIFQCRPVRCARKCSKIANKRLRQAQSGPMTNLQTGFGFGYWQPVKDGNNLLAFDIMLQLFVSAISGWPPPEPVQPESQVVFGPGEKLVLLGADGLALFVWRKFIDKSGQTGVNCAVFRNESGRRASDLILEAEVLAWVRWPGERLYTYVNANKVQGTCPGYCFHRARWRHCGETQAKGLLIFEKYPKESQP